MFKMLTPSEKIKNIVNPQQEINVSAKTNKTLVFAKMIIGSPIPFLLVLFCISLMIGMSPMEIFGWGSCAFTVIYILIDRFCFHKEFRFFLTQIEIPIFFLVLFTFLSLKINAPEVDAFQKLGQLRWILMFFLLTYSLDLFPGVNKYIYIFIGIGTAITIYAIVQHFTGIDLIRGASERAVERSPFDETLFQNTGFLSDHLTFGYSFGQIFCFSFAAFLLSDKKNIFYRILFFISSALFFVTLVWTYGRGVWLATIAAIFILTGLVNKKYFIFGVLSIILISVSSYNLSDDIKKRFDSITETQYESNKDRRDLWNANLEMFKDYPWFGVGYHQNEKRVLEYYQKLGIQNNFIGHAHNNYLNSLATTGILGFMAFMGFILTSLFMTYRLWQDIPESAFWHRVIALGALGSQIHMHTGGLTQWNFGDKEVVYMYIFILSLVCYVSAKYRSGLVPDDQSL